MQSSPFAAAPATSCARSPTITARPAAAGSAAARSESAAATMSALPSGTEPAGTEPSGTRARSRAGGLVGGGAPDAVEESGDAVVRQDSAGKPFRLLGRDGDGPPRGDEVLEEAADSRVQPALRYSCGCVVRAVDADGVFQLCGRNAGDFRQGMAELGPNHGVHPGLVRNRQAKLDEGRGDTVGNTPGGIDKSAVKVEDHGHCCMRHRLSFSRVCCCQKFACSFRNTSGNTSGIHHAIHQRIHPVKTLRGGDACGGSLPAPPHGPWRPVFRRGARRGTRPCGSRSTWPPARGCRRRPHGRHRTRRRGQGPRSSRRS